MLKIERNQSKTSVFNFGTAEKNIDQAGVYLNTGKKDALIPDLLCLLLNQYRGSKHDLLELRLTILHVLITLKTTCLTQSHKPPK